MTRYVNHHTRSITRNRPSPNQAVDHQTQEVETNAARDQDNRRIVVDDLFEATNGGSNTQPSRIAGAQSGMPQWSVPVTVVVPLRLVPVVCLPDGRNGTRRKVGHTIWIIAHVRHLGRPDHCRLGGKCDIRLQPVCISLTTTPRQQRGMIQGCRCRSMQMCRNTNAISVES